MTPSASLTQRRRIATQLGIARAAATLFTEHGVDGVTADAIASQAGISLRTFYRYFRTKEDAVAPLLAFGASQWRAAIASSGTGDPRAQISSIMRQVLTPVDEESREGLRWTHGLLRAAKADPALRSVWQRVNQDSEVALTRIIGNLVGPRTDPFTVRILAATTTAAMRIAVEHWSTLDEDPDGSLGIPARLAQESFDQMAAGIHL
ncbi:TetR family transcriptional regulator [Jonesiaceae bacterium BS-20]|uniref:TetR family transcriptional regulator n=1 Tax=Jonesiaceae bacterium BS-20 TaxID=3120821 RepID=A0AAU7DT36_9MICO